MRRSIIRESDLQATIVAALEQAGFRVKHTSAFRQKGASGVSKGIPDLLVSHADLKWIYIGLEVKTATGAVRPEQRQAQEDCEYMIVRSVEDALDAVLEVTEKYGGPS
ncbi:MAG: hypothetical protein JNK63_09795, partial [Chthonomonas sp.]|nr:hypothetical protein [Chthonomonas sp.]